MSDADDRARLCGRVRETHEALKAESEKRRAFERLRDNSPPAASLVLTPSEAKFIADCIMVGADGATALTTKKDAASSLAFILMSGAIGDRINLTISHTNETNEKEN